MLLSSRLINWMEHLQDPGCFFEVHPRESVVQAMSTHLVVLLDLRVEVLLQQDAKLLTERLQLLEVLLVLFLVLNLRLDACAQLLC